MNSFPVINDTYFFDCTRCGNCCTGDIRITLNLYDLYKMARFLKMASTEKLFEQNYVQLFKHEHNVWLPEIKFKSRPLTHCPFLLNDADEYNYIQGLCSLHPEYKPLVCALAPVGRILDFDEKEDQFVFIKPAPDCPGIDIQKQNHLSNDIIQLEKELNWQKRFFKILDRLKKAEHSERYFPDNLYQFPVNTEFSKIMQAVDEKSID